MTDKEFLYSMYDADLVDYAMDSTKDFYRKETFEITYSLSNGEVVREGKINN